MTTRTMVVASRDVELGERVNSFAWLAHLDVEMVGAQTPGQVCSLAKQGTVRLLLADDTLGTDSLSALVRRVRKVRPELTIVCVASSSDPSTEIELRRMGVLFLMVRPVDTPLLSRVLCSALESDTTKYLRTPVSPPVGVKALPQNA